MSNEVHSRFSGRTGRSYASLIELTFLKHLGPHILRGCSPSRPILGWNVPLYMSQFEDLELEDSTGDIPPTGRAISIDFAQLQSVLCFEHLSSTHSYRKWAGLDLIAKVFHGMIWQAQCSIRRFKGDSLKTKNYDQHVRALAFHNRKSVSISGVALTCHSIRGISDKLGGKRRYSQSVGTEWFGEC